jgi:hypothetical protein
LETVERDYADKGVNFYYVYKPLAHAEYDGYLVPVSIEERLMHVEEAKRRLGTSVNWLADTMDNVFHDAMGQTPNSEIVIDPDGYVVVARTWSDPDQLRRDLELFVGPAEHRTTIEELDLPAQPPPPTVAKGVVPRIERPSGMMTLLQEPVLESSEHPFFVKIRAEGDNELMSSGNGTMYLGFHLDPLYRVHWNNEAGPVKYEIKAPPGVTVTPASGTGPDVEAPADADPREFLVDVTATRVDQPLELDVFYFGCDDALTFCIPVNQSYRVYLQQDMNHGPSHPGRGSQGPGGALGRPEGAGSRDGRRAR